MRVNQKITVGSITINAVQNSSIVQIGSSGMIQSQSESLQPPAPPTNGAPSKGFPAVTEAPSKVPPAFKGVGPIAPQTGQQANVIPDAPTFNYKAPLEPGPVDAPAAVYPEFNFPAPGGNHTNNT